MAATSRPLSVRPSRTGRAREVFQAALVALAVLAHASAAPRLVASPPVLPPDQVETLTSLAAGITRPLLDLDTFHPAFPSKRASHPYSGTWLFRATVAADGSVSHVEILRGVHPQLDPAIQKALTAARFTPARRDGRPTPVVIIDLLHIQRRPL